jgi:hypothetical protein
MTGGKSYRDDKDALAAAATNADVFRPVPESHASLQPLWPWLVFLAAICLLFDVALRRIAIQPEAVWNRAVVVWSKLRGQAVEESTTEFIERLKSRKAAVGEAMDKKKAGKKYESVEGGKVYDAPVVVSPTTPVDKPKPKPKEEAKEEDFATRLMRAKKKAMEERDKDKK